MQTTELRNEAALRSRAVSKNVVCGLSLQREPGLLAIAARYNRMLQELNADDMAKAATVDPVKTKERTTNP